MSPPRLILFFFFLDSCWRRLLDFFHPCEDSSSKVFGDQCHPSSVFPGAGRRILSKGLLFLFYRDTNSNRLTSFFGLEGIRVRSCPNFARHGVLSWRQMPLFEWIWFGRSYPTQIFRSVGPLSRDFLKVLSRIINQRSPENLAGFVGAHFQIPLVRGSRIFVPAGTPGSHLP